MAHLDPELCGEYLGRKKIRPGREDELSPKERKDVERAKTVVDLKLAADGHFQRQVTAGKWHREGDVVHCQPLTFGGETLETMRARSEAMGRMFGLAFVFDPFQLVVTAEGLATPDDGGPIYTEFQRAS